MHAVQPFLVIFYHCISPWFLRESLLTVNIVVIIHDKPSLFYNISLNFEKVHNLAIRLAANS